MNPGTSMGMLGGMGGMNPMGMMNPMMGMNPEQMQMMGMGGMGMGNMGGMGGMGGMPGMAGMGGMGPGGPGGPMGGGGMGMGGGGMGPGGPAGPMGGDMGPDSRFYKTKMCHKFEQGECPYGDTCKYAHGPGDMRHAGGPAGPRPTGSGRVMTPNGPPAGMMPGMMGGGGNMMAGGMGMQPRPPASGGGGGAGGGDKSGHWRTRLCDQFMQSGACRYSDKCTFAHGRGQLRQAPGGGGGIRSNQSGGAGSGGQKRALDQQGAGGGDANKRQRAEAVAPPPHELVPDKNNSLNVDAIRARFKDLIQEANRFAADTGYTVALFGVGGVFADIEAGDIDEMVSLADVKAKDPIQHIEPGLKVAVLKHATGGVASQLVNRSEIIKFVSQRGVKNLAEMVASQAEQEEASA